MSRTARPPLRRPEHLDGLSPYQTGATLEQVRRASGLASVVRLASNENPLGPSPLALSAMAGALSELHRYPDGACQALRRALADRYSLQPDQVTVGDGSSELIDMVARTFVREPFNSNSLAQLAARAALGDADHLDRTLKLNAGEKQRLGAALAARGLETLPSQTNFLFVDLGRDAREVFALLLESGVAVRPYGRSPFTTWVRVTIGTPPDNDRFLMALDAVLAGEVV